MDPSKKLFDYAKKGQFEKIESLLEKYPNLDLNICDNNGNFPLYWAAFMGHAKTCEILIKLGANVNALNYFGKTPLHWIAHCARDKKWESIIKSIDDVSDKQRETPLHDVARWGHANTCEVLIKARSKITTRIFQKLNNKCKELIVLYENEVDPELTELNSKIKKRKEEKKKLLSNSFPSVLVELIGQY